MLNVSFAFPGAVSLLQQYEIQFKPYFEKVKSLPPSISWDKGNENEAMERVLNDPGFKNLVENAQLAARAAVTLTLENLAQVYGLDQTYLNHMPHVVALDPVTYFNANRTKSSESKYLLGLPATFFSSSGLWEFKHPQGTVLSLYLPHVNTGCIIEETFHGLQHIYEEILGDRDDDTYLKGLGLVELGIAENGIIPIQLTKRTQPHETKRNKSMDEHEIFYQLVFREAAAYFTDRIFAQQSSAMVRTLHSNLVMLAPEGVSDNVFEESLSLLCTKGPDVILQYLLQQHKSKSVVDMKQGILGLGARYFDDLIHFLGYGFAEHLQAKLTDASQLAAVGAIFFRKEQAPRQKLTELIAL